MRMEPSELVGRVQDQLLRLQWRLTPPDISRLAQQHAQPNRVRLKAMPAPSAVPAEAADSLRQCADRILAGQWTIFGAQHPALGEDPDWFVDAHSGLRAPSSDYTFAIAYRDAARCGDIKFIWEPSRFHHLTVLAAAYFLTGDERYATRVAGHLRSWWQQNPFLHGPHWISGIEIGLRLIAMVWIRQLLAAWPEVSDLFEDNAAFVDQLYAHQLWLSRFPSRGSSANNHLIAEAAGQFVASCAFPMFRQSARWRTAAAETLAREAVAQTFPCGMNRELASDYHGFVLELLLIAAVQGDAAGCALAPSVWQVIERMTDAVASVLDEAGHPPRQGDSDEGIGLLIDDPDSNRWRSLLATGARLFGRPAWWPAQTSSDVRSVLLAHDVPCRQRESNAAGRARRLFPEAGQAYLVCSLSAFWARCDHGPHGFGRIAAHAHADALSIECRIAGVEILADPGTYCYHSEPRWRDYFRSTLGHNTLQAFGHDQSSSGGPFLWTQHARSRLLAVEGLDDEAADASWMAEHAGYPNLVHRRSARLLRNDTKLVVTDTLLDSGDVPVPVKLCWHLGPDVACELVGDRARLAWPGGRGELALPSQLTWQGHHGDEALPAGWYSPSFGHKRPSTTLIGSGVLRAGASLVTELIWSSALGEP
ncbi:alginate lyase family protein [Bradyrhizobium sp. SSBR45R]|uniref:heparinase II/III family protein n=2 Tax=unclassified Bradyrhizobium TaxID=2631580 RepID=UPI0024E15C91|nr:alginate lyase family protein [Bradyrhizobium sp. SSBR45R]